MRRERKPLMATLILGGLLLGACTPKENPIPPEDASTKKVTVIQPGEGSTVIAPTEESGSVEQESQSVAANQGATAAGKSSGTVVHRAAVSPEPAAQPAAASASAPSGGYDFPEVVAVKPAAQPAVALDEISTAAGEADGSGGPGSFTVLLISLLIAMGLTAPFMFGGPLYRKMTGAKVPNHA